MNPTALIKPRSKAEAGLLRLSSFTDEKSSGSQSHQALRMQGSGQHWSPSWDTSTRGSRALLLPTHPTPTKRIPSQSVSFHLPVSL